MYEIVAGVLAELDGVGAMPYHGWARVSEKDRAVFERGARSFIQATGGEGPVVNIHSCGHRLLSLGCKAAHRMAGEPEPQPAPSEG